jgi:GST-like protein
MIGSWAKSAAIVTQAAGNPTGTRGNSMSDTPTETGSIILYGVASPNVVKVAIMLEELDLAYALQYVAVFQGEQFTPWFQALNPLGKVPVLVDPALRQPLAESGAILLWLAEQHRRFLPESGASRYETLQWLMIQMSAIGPMLGQFTHFRLLPEHSEPYALGRYGALAATMYRQIDRRLETREWLAGDAYSIADIATFPWAEYVDRHGLDSGDYPHMQRWRAAINARPAVLRAKTRVFGECADASQSSIAAATPEDLDRFFSRTQQVPQKDYSAVKLLR